MPWIFRIDDFSLVQSAIETNENFVFEITQKRNFGGSDKDKVLLLVKEGQNWVFPYWCVIYDIKTEEEREEAETPRTFKISLTNFEAVTPPNKLEDYSYTLMRVTNFTSPIQHFKRRYARILDIEFEAVVRNQIFTSRTVFGKLINSLHPDHRINFFRSITESKPEIYFRPSSYLEALKMLRAYLEENLFQHIRWIKASHEMLGAMLEPAQFNEIGFLDPSELDSPTNWERRIDKLSSQIEILRTNEFPNNPGSFFDELESEIATSIQNETTFNRLFRDRPLPIQFNF